MKMNHTKKEGFTLLEIIIVIIIVGVLASLALPRFFSTVEFSRSTEALAAIGSIRKSMERCATLQGDFQNCDNVNRLDLENPSNTPGTHFTYEINATGADTFTITARRNALDGGNTNHRIYLTYNNGTITRAGTGAFQGIN